ncbi:hypothetical protein HPB47_004941 [Ixodes persulcatus]|uniref:Uncharacterized protein n=1 Tax=Ixodes persulcatus TaxID=34615 RepID=A0AC60PF39_IXOPE|nr:hypothetical protein HPB47_004941 [Ixodes persulcatus]
MHSSADTSASCRRRDRGAPEKLPESPGRVLRDCTAKMNVPGGVAASLVMEEPLQLNPFDSASPHCSIEVPRNCVSPAHSSVAESDATYSPSRSAEGFESDGQTASSPPAPEKERQFLVFESCLRELFRTCQECSRPCQNDITSQGTLITVVSICPLEHVRKWSSQPIINGRGAGNILLTSHLLFSGAQVTNTLRMLRHMNVEVMSDQMYNIYQNALLFPAVDKIWLQEQQELISQLDSQEVDITADGRFDSPGFSAKYLTYSAHVQQINKILHSVQVQLGESERAMASVNMEKEGLMKQLEFFKEKCIHIRSLGTDRHPAIRKHMETQEPGIAHYFDIWHISKSVKKKMAAASKRAGCQELQMWVQATTNHLYYSAKAGAGDRKLTVDVWLSLQNHAINEHTGHGGGYPRAKVVVSSQISKYSAECLVGFPGFSGPVCSGTGIGYASGHGAPSYSRNRAADGLLPQRFPRCSVQSHFVSCLSAPLIHFLVASCALASAVKDLEDGQAASFCRGMTAADPS